MVLGLVALGGLSLGDSQQEWPSVSGVGLNTAPMTWDMETVGLAPEGDQLLDAGLSTEVIETILNAKASSTRRLYTLKFRLLAAWYDLDPVHCLVGLLLEILQEQLSAMLAPVTLKVYTATIATGHMLIDGMSLGRHSLISCFLHGARQMRSICPQRVPSWDLSIVLRVIWHSIWTLRVSIWETSDPLGGLSRRFAGPFSFLILVRLCPWTSQSIIAP